MKNIAAIRTDYKMGSLDDADMASDPIEQFTKWWDAAIFSQIEEPNAMSIATVNEAGQPSLRMVLLKDYSKEGFVFFTNYDSSKGHHIAENNSVAVLFFWKELERQVRIEGEAVKLGEADSDAYFASRPRGSQLGAWASHQSNVVKDRLQLEQQLAEFEVKFSNTDIPRPPHWGGYLVKPSLIEFWQGRSSRMHDRFQYSKEPGGWSIQRLSP